MKSDQAYMEYIQHPPKSVVLSGHYDQYDKQVKNLELQKEKQVGPIHVLNERIDQIIDRVTDAEYIFSRKFKLVEDHIKVIKEKI